jgi:hypothetical protein
MNRFSLQNVKDNEVNRVLRQIQDGLNKLADAHTESVPVAVTTRTSIGVLNAKVSEVASTIASMAEEVGPAGTSYTHVQSSASNAWSVTHNLGYYPSVTVIDSGGSEVVGEVDYTNVNSLVIHFTSPFSGNAYFS